MTREDMERLRAEVFGQMKYVNEHSDVSRLTSQ